MASGEAIPTQNRRGHQMATSSPLVEEWISSFDGRHPLLDVGCAYGINTFEALKRGIPTIALDMEERHLDCIREHLTLESKPLATIVFGCLPSNIPLPDNSVSGILVSQVLHFVEENEIEEALSVLHRILIEGGKLAITVLSEKFLAYTVSKEKEEQFYHRLKNGEKWPGIIEINSEFISNISRYMKSDALKIEYEEQNPHFLHVFSKNTMEDHLKDIGFKITTSRYAQDPGYPNQEGYRCMEGINLQIVAEKVRLH